MHLSTKVQTERCQVFIVYIYSRGSKIKEVRVTVEGLGDEISRNWRSFVVQPFKYSYVIIII